MNPDQRHDLVQSCLLIVVHLRQAPPPERPRTHQTGGNSAEGAGQVDLSGPLGAVNDWDIGESPTVTVRDALREAFPGTGDDAAITVHTVLSGGCGAPGRDHCRPAREHASRHLPIDEAWRGGGLLADLGYASLERLRTCEAHEGRCVIHLQDPWKPNVDYIACGQVTQEFFPGTDLDALLAEEILVLDGRAIDADVHMGEAKQPLHL